MSNVISINKLRLSGTTLLWRHKRFELTPQAAYAVAEEIHELLSLPGQSALHGLVINVTGRRIVQISGRDFAPAVMTRGEAAGLALGLARASTRVVENRKRV